MAQTRLETAKAILGTEFGYLREKLGNILLELHCVADLSRDDGSGSRARRQELVAALSGAIGDTIKLLAAVSGERISGKDLASYQNEILRNGRDGYEIVAYSLGLIEETTKQRAWRELRDLLNRLELAVKGSRAENRTKIHEMLLPYEHDRRPLLQKFIELTDRVTMGELEWRDYQDDALRLINRIREKHLPTCP